MPANIATTKKMIVYAKDHRLLIPAVSTRVPFWGKGKSTLAWRVSGHAFGRKNADARKTRQLVDLLFPVSMGEMIVRVVLGEVGVKENPPSSNSGPRVRIYQAVTGAYHAAWCGSFAAWAILTAAHRLGKRVQLAPNHAYVPNITDTIRRGLHGWHQVAFASARGGDTVTLWSSGHVETVISLDGEYLNTVGGNTSPVGQNNHGGMVAKARRHRSEVTVIGRAW